MPVAAKLSRKFHDRLGDDIANELVEWFNAVDLTYKNDLRELNELHWQRFYTEFQVVQSAWDVKFGELKAEFKTTQATLRAELIKWMFPFWIGTIVPLGGLMVALAQPR